jgi:hypothetical protein
MWAILILPALESMAVIRMSGIRPPATLRAAFRAGSAESNLLIRSADPAQREDIKKHPCRCKDA